MHPGYAFLRLTELDRTTFPEMRELIAQAEAEGTPTEPRSYPGYPRLPLERLRNRRLKGFDGVLTGRRCLRQLSTATIPRRILSRLLQLSHGITADHHRGPVPSAGGLQALELYMVNLASDWLPAGLYHYDRVGHHLSQIAPLSAKEKMDGQRGKWLERVPSLGLVEGGSILWVLVGDAPRVAAKYGERGYRFLLLEAGHLMQDLCLVSASLGLGTVPLGGCLEQEIAHEFLLPATDVVLYVGICGSSI